jgi:hypothetical protein
MKPEHPGSIVFADADAGTEEVRPAAQVPEDVRFVRSDERWIPVARVVKSRSGARVEIRCYDQQGRLLSTTVGNAGPPR